MRVVLTVDGPRDYEVVHNAGNVSISVDGGGSFASWRVGRPPFASPALVKPAVQRAMQMNAPVTATVTQVSAPSSVTPTDGRPVVYVPSAQQRQQPRITIAWERADIRDVLAAFAGVLRPHDPPVERRRRHDHGRDHRQAVGRRHARDPERERIRRRRG